MNDPLKEYYGAYATDALLALPRLEFTLDGIKAGAWARLLDKISKMTGETLGKWPGSPWFDQDGNGTFPMGNEQLPFSEWGNYFNQRQLRSYEVDCIVPSDIKDDELPELFGSSDQGIHVFIGRLPHIVKRTRWVLYAVTEDVLLFVTAAEYSEWVSNLRAWYLKRGGTQLYYCYPEQTAVTNTPAESDGS